MFSQALASEEHLHVGQEITLPTAFPITLRVAALSTNIGWAPGAIVMNADDYARASGSADASAFNVLLARYSGQDDLAVGSPIANRGSAEAEALIGYFLNTLVLRTRLDGDPTFREALQRWKHLDDTVVAGVVAKQKPTLVIGEYDGSRRRRLS